MKRGQKLLFYFLLFIAYLGLGVLFTWPLAKNFSSSIPGQTSFTDGPFFLWNLWQVKNTLLHGQNPLFTNLVFYPAQVNLSLHTLTLTSGIFAIPLTKFFSLITTENILIIGSIALSALGTALLVNYLTESPIAGIIPGIIFGFSPYIASHLMAGHFNLTTVWLVPFIIIFFTKLLREQNIINPIALGILLAMQFYLDLQTSSAVLVILAFIFISSAIFNFKKTFSMARALSYCLVLSLFAVLFIIPYVHWTWQFWPDKTLTETFNNGDLGIIFGLNPLSPILKGNSALLVKLIGSYRENAISLGYSVMALGLLSLIFIKKHLKEKLTFIVLASVGVVLAAGPYLQINGQISKNIHLPFYYISQLPFFNIGVVPTRYILVSFFTLAILAGFFVDGIFAKLKFKGAIILKIVLMAIFAGVISLEYYCGPMAIDRLQVSPIYAKVANERGDFTVLPVAANAHDQYFQTIYDKKIVSGSLSRRIQPYYLNQYKQTPGVWPLTSEKLESEYFSGRDFDRDLVLSSFQKLKIKYIFVDKTAHTEEVIGRARYYLSDTLALPIYYEDSMVIVYKNQV